MAWCNCIHLFIYWQGVHLTKWKNSIINYSIDLNYNFGVSPSFGMEFTTHTRKKNQSHFFCVSKRENAFVDTWDNQHQFVVLGCTNICIVLSTERKKFPTTKKNSVQKHFNHEKGTKGTTEINTSNENKKIIVMWRGHKKNAHTHTHSRTLE